MSMDKQTVQRVANLASLEITDEEANRLAPQLSGILDWVEQLSEINTDDVEPLANVANIELKLREDEVKDGDCIEKIIFNAPEETQGFFVVPKVVE